MQGRDSLVIFITKEPSVPPLPSEQIYIQPDLNSGHSTPLISQLSSTGQRLGGSGSLMKPLAYPPM